MTEEKEGSANGHTDSEQLDQNEQNQIQNSVTGTIRSKTNTTESEPEQTIQDVAPWCDQVLILNPHLREISACRAACSICRASAAATFPGSS